MLKFGLHIYCCTFTEGLLALAGLQHGPRYLQVFYGKWSTHQLKFWSIVHVNDLAIWYNFHNDQTRLSLVPVVCKAYLKKTLYDTGLNPENKKRGRLKKLEIFL